jgi:hypothetical protein
MQKRHNRIPVNIKADLISSVKTYEGFIMNLSDDLQNNSGETLNLNCEVKWLHTYKTSPHDLTNGMGIEIIDTPQEYRDFFIFKVVE